MSTVLATIIAAVISSLTTLAVCLINNKAQYSKFECLMEYKIDELTKRVDKHNNLVERMYNLEEKTMVNDEKMKAFKVQLDTIERMSNND